MSVREVEKPKFSDWFAGLKTAPKTPKLLEGVQIVGSGKGAITVILKYLAEKGVLLNKLDEILVPDWLGYWVYNQMQPFAFPAKRFSERTKVLFVYHQYGFPQDMDKILDFAKNKELVVIEDCAHALDSFYKGRPLGSMGHFALYSFSKWFFCFALGGVRSKFPDFSKFTEKLLAEVPWGVTLVKDLAKYWYETSSFSQPGRFQRFASLFVNLSYALYGEALKPGAAAQKLLLLKLDKERKLRQERYQYFLKETNGLGVCDHLEKEGITPYLIPFRCPPAKTENLFRQLRDKGIQAGLYKFDINRNLLSPNFVQCVCIPCHSGISNEDFEAIIKLVKQVV